MRNVRVNTSKLKMKLLIFLDYGLLTSLYDAGAKLLKGDKRKRKFVVYYGINSYSNTTCHVQNAYFEIKLESY